MIDFLQLVNKLQKDSQEDGTGHQSISKLKMPGPAHLLHSLHLLHHRETETETGGRYREKERKIEWESQWGEEERTERRQEKKKEWDRHEKYPELPLSLSWGPIESPILDCIHWAVIYLSFIRETAIDSAALWWRPWDFLCLINVHHRRLDCENEPWSNIQSACYKITANHHLCYCTCKCTLQLNKTCNDICII